MKVRFEDVQEVEKNTDSVSLNNIKRNFPYIYIKIKNHYVDRIFSAPIGDKKVLIQFIKNSDLLDILEQGDLRRNLNKKKTRGILGRPYVFCKDCDKKEFCTMDIPCEKRDQAIEEKKKKKSIAEDKRFFKSGRPRKKFILCEYFKTRKESSCVYCSFYENGRCTLEK